MKPWTLTAEDFPMEIFRTEPDDAIQVIDWKQMCVDADFEMKQSNGHQFVQVLKTRCTHCGRSPRAKGKCPAWMHTFTSILYRKVNDSIKGTGEQPNLSETYERSKEQPC